jgi:hypothetical protein
MSKNKFSAPQGKNREERRAEERDRTSSTTPEPPELGSPADLIARRRALMMPQDPPPELGSAEDLEARRRAVADVPDDGRESSLQKDVMLVATCGMSLLNGMPWSPMLLPVTILLTPFLAGTFLGSPLVLTYLASMLVSAFTLLLAGVPAALYERFTGQTDSTPNSIAIWLVGVLVLVAVPFWLLT